MNQHSGLSEEAFEIVLDMLRDMVGRILGRGADGFVELSDVHAPYAFGMSFPAPFMFKGMYFYVHPMIPDALFFCVGNRFNHLCLTEEIHSLRELQKKIKEGAPFIVSPRWSTFETFERLISQLTSAWNRLWSYHPTVDEFGRINWRNYHWRVVEGTLEVERTDGSYMPVPDKATMKRILDT